MSNRRRVLIGISSVMLWPATARALEAARSAQIGYLHPEAPASRNRRFEVFKQHLRELGWFEGKNIAFEYRTAAGVRERLSALASELVKLDVNIIVADGDSSSALAAKKATSRIPIVFPTIGDPVALGLVASLAKPGGNVTGLSNAQIDVILKRLELMREIVPNAKRIAFLHDLQNPSHSIKIESTAQQIKLNVKVIGVPAAAALDNIFSTLARERIDTVVLSGGSMFFAESSRLARLGLKHRIAIIGDNNVQAESGCLASYGANRADVAYRLARIVDKVLKGTKPADIPVELPTKFELVLNARTAKVIGLNIPQEVLLRADRVIE